ncbi:ABC transporter [Vallitalea longa]|uniref:ABC transporter n=1 Tax=Vallitalea longa TaxID=2936439 RepID=A0A9W6DG57_9FIRM|nr:ABC transporter ATP-binding protein [Vallitalea longa]GKX30123.1 ABC transporter [Vallitalea longa]
MLEIRGLTKNYRKFTALKGINLNVEKGEIFGFIGPNGAGKTTTIKIMCGLLSPTNGEVYINGINALKNIRRAKEYIGYMPDFFGVYDNLKVTEYLEFYSSIYGIKGDESKKLINDLLELVNLEEKADFFVDSLSRGMKQKLCLARCLVNNPELLVLDEPASGMDPRARADLKRILCTLRDMGKTVIISSHILTELSEICTSIGIINKGEMVISGNVEDVTNKVYNNQILEIEVTDSPDKAETVLKEMDFVQEINPLGNKLEVSINGDNEQIKTLLKILIIKDVPVITLNKKTQNLEDIFLEVTKEA